MSVDPRIWSNIRGMYLAAAALFLVNNGLGFANILVDTPLPRAQLLMHLHAGTIGWITLAIMASMVWAYAADRDVPERFIQATTGLAWFAVIAFTGYVVSFGMAFNFEGGFYFLLPIFGVAAMLSIWWAFGMSWSQMRKAPQTNITHVLFTTALAVAALGALMGVLLGLGYSLGDTIVPGDEPVGTHAGVMDGYILLGLAGIIALVTRPDQARNKRTLGVAISWAGSALAIWASLIFGIEPLAGLSALLLLIGLGFYMSDLGLRAFRAKRSQGGHQVSLWFSGLWIPIYVLVFVSFIPIFIRGDMPPVAMLIVWTHLGFVGAATNLILVAQSRFGGDLPELRIWEPAAAWLLNIGFIAFAAGELAAGRPDGAYVMGAGVVLAVIVTMYRLVKTGEGDTAKTMTA